MTRANRKDVLYSAKVWNKLLACSFQKYFFCLFVRDLDVRTWYMDLLGTFAGAVFFFFNSIDNLDKCLLAVRLSSNSENFLE